MVLKTRINFNGQRQKLAICDSHDKGKKKELVEQKFQNESSFIYEQFFLFYFFPLGIVPLPVRIYKERKKLYSNGNPKTRQNKEKSYFSKKIQQNGGFKKQNKLNSIEK